MRVEANALAVNSDMHTKDEVTPLPQKRRDKSDLGEDFTAPDGGWAWMVCIAAGLSNLSIYPSLQQFGFIFRERMTVLGMSSSQITSIINTNPAISACTGLLNGPMFRRFSFRQVALTGALLIFSGILLTAFCESFLSYMVCYALLYGFGLGLSVSASSLAINTYFKVKRRKATGFTWTITGLGPIFLPYFVTFLLSVYDVQGTVLIFAAIALHAVVCGLIYQPVQYHAPSTLATQPAQLPTVEAPAFCSQCGGRYETQQRIEKDTALFSSQYLYQEDDADMPGYEIVEPGTPMLSRANDGWFGSKLSLASTTGRTRFRRISSSRDVEVSSRLKSTISEEHEEPEEAAFLKPNNFHRERDEVLRHSHSRVNIEEPTPFLPHSCVCEQQTLLSTPVAVATASDKQMLATKEQDVPFMQKVVAFFDLGLLRDITFVNLVAGLTIINFGELNFSILTPFILNDFGFDTPQITLAMSLLASLDIIMRFLVPFITEKIPWDNRVFFLIGVVGIALGRTVVACTRSYRMILCSFTWIGICKGIRTVFWPLILPGYVPLKRLPAASGIQLLISGLFTLAAGPFVGLLRDHFDYSLTLHCLNMMTFLAAFSWILEALIRYCHRRHKESTPAL